MKTKEVFLDFTPLLDVTLILLFFFLLFSTFEVEETKARINAEIENVQEQLEYAEYQSAQADEKYAEANALVEQLYEDLKIVDHAKKGQSSYIQAMMEFNRGTNIKLIMAVKDGTPTLRLFQGETLLETTTPDSELSEIICNALNKAGYTKNDTVLCEFIFNGLEAGTASAYRKVIQNLMYVKGSYQHFYYSETDISMGVD